MEVTDFSAILVKITCQALKVQLENSNEQDQEELQWHLSEVKSVEKKFNIHPEVIKLLNLEEEVEEESEEEDEEEEEEEVDEDAE